MKNIIGLLIAAVIVLVLTFLIKVDTDKKIEVLEKKNEKLEMRCDSIELLNDSIKAQMNIYSSRIDSMKKIDENLSKDYIENKNQIKNIKQKYEKNNRIDSFTTPDIIKYFTDSI